MYTRTWV